MNNRTERVKCGVGMEGRTEKGTIEASVLVISFHSAVWCYAYYQRRKLIISFTQL